MVARVKETAVRRMVLGEVRDELKQRSPLDGYRPYDASRLSDDVKKAFEAVSKDKPIEAAVDVNAVVGAYAASLKKTLGEVNTTAPEWLSKSEANKVKDPAMRSRVLAARAEAVRGKDNLSEDALLRRAARFIADHSAPVGDSGNAIDVFFPAFDVGNGENWAEGVPGISAQLVTDKDAAKTILKMLERWASDGAAERLNTFDPEKEQLIVVRDSGDETHWFPAAIDKRTGKARGFDTDHNEVDFSSFETHAEFESVFGPGSAAGAEEGEYWDVFSAQIDKLFSKARDIPIEKMDPPEIDKPALTAAAAKLVQKYFADRAELPAGIDDTYKKTLEAIHRAIKDGATITVGESYGDPILHMPRKFLPGESDEEWRVGWAFNELTTTEPSLRRFYNVNATAAPAEG